MGINTIIVDDSRLFRELLSNVCIEIGCSVLASFERGDHLMESIKAGNFKDLEVLFLDINMPGISGKEVLSQILAIMPNLVVIMISTISDNKTVEECLSLGASNYINKDTKVAQLKTLVQDTFDMQGL